MIRNRNAWFFSTAIIGILFSTSLVTQAETGVTVDQIEETALDSLLTDRDNRLLVNFMAAWCAPCVDELPILKNLYNKYRDQGIRIIGISIDHGGPSAMQPIISRLKISFPVYWYGEKAINKFKLNAIPMLLFIRQGKIVERLPGKRTEKLLDQKIQELLK